MTQQAYKSMMYAGALLTACSIVAIAADAGFSATVLFCTGFLVLLAGAVGYLWNGE